MEYGAYGIHQLLVDELVHYINTQYLSKSPLLLKYSSSALLKENTLFKEPYIETSPAYKTDANGIAGSTIIEPWLKQFFNSLAEANLGVYKAPFCHQIEALEHFCQGHNLFVATGTGSGKTECFLWPILAKMATEAHSNITSWNQRGVRCIIMYPMNALVSDQLSRMRRLMADSDGKFLSIFKETCPHARRPQFGMYTGRTPYAGQNDKAKNKELANTYRKFLNKSVDEDPISELFLERMRKEGRTPAKKDLNAFVQNLSEGSIYTSPEDAELLTRIEMQRTTPDILITNYSMLEYMLLRPIESPIWDNTKQYLELDHNNKLLFIIDEAHMYHGSSGGEVAMLLRRLFSRIGIKRSQIQCILTTASMPNKEGDDEAVFNFARNLSAGDKNTEFVLLRGHRQEINTSNLIKLNYQALQNANPNDFELDLESRLQALNKFWMQQQAKDLSNWPWPCANLDEACYWLYDHLFDYQEFNTLACKCRKEACSLKELAQDLFTDTYNQDKDLAQKLVSVLLSIAPLAHNKQNSVLFPARMHMLFRGLKGIYCCTNVNCKGSHVPYEERMGLGTIFFDAKNHACPYCHSVIRELVRDRRCGALFIKGFVDKEELNNAQAKERGIYLWHSPSIVSPKSLTEIHLYVPSERDQDLVELMRNYSQCYLNSQSGYLFFDDRYAMDENCLRLFYQQSKVKIKKKGKQEYIDTNDRDILTFSSCPHCTHILTNSPLLNFNTRGNNSFFNLIKTQFSAQPAVAGKTIKEQGENVRYPNEGRKILIFSDSRQRAAKLARDMSATSDDTACRQIMGLALTHMQKQSGDKANLSLQKIYSFFALHAAYQNCPLFQSSLYHHTDNTSFRNYSMKFLKEATRPQTINRRRRGRPTAQSVCPKLSLDELLKIHIDNDSITTEQIEDGFYEQLLKCYCQSSNNLSDCAISYLRPTEKVLESLGDQLCQDPYLAQLETLVFGSSSNIPEDENQYWKMYDQWILELCSAWIQYLCVDHIALGNKIGSEIRGKISHFYTIEGVNEHSAKLSNTILKAINLDQSQIDLINHINTVLIETLLSNDDNTKFLLLEKLAAVIDSKDNPHTWYRCDKCSQISPFMLNGHCPHCASEHIHAMTEQDKDALSFWRAPILEAIAGKPIYVIDTQEHTAQLQHKDQQEELLSKTEQYEMRFQDFLDKGETPVDILSSTTTMEVGIDIGSLVGVGLRNIPPMRENYQQRAGRAGRRGSSLSTIVTFCEDGPHDSIYFNDPRPMFRGEPRSPWIDINSSKILERHLSLIAIEKFISKLNEELTDELKQDCLIYKSSKNNQLSLDSFATTAFINNYQDSFANFVTSGFDIDDMLLPPNSKLDLNHAKKQLLDGIENLKQKVECHPELYQIDRGFKKPKLKSLLDSLYEEGLIPTYSFPKNVVSTYICNSKGEVEYEVQRSLDIAISEYAPGRAIVVDKKTYQIGGIYTNIKKFNNSYPREPARKFIEDPNYNKQLYKCPECQWFGTEKPNSTCPFCNSSKVQECEPLAMLRPWGFAPVDGKSIPIAKLEEDYSFAHKPQYSTLPKSADMEMLPGYQKVSVAKRTDQNIIMLNEGPENKGFRVCVKCGAAIPVSSPKKTIHSPYLKSDGTNVFCQHEWQTFNLGYDFKTDMLVVQFSIAGEDIDTTYWLNSAGQSLAEAIRLGASKLLDIEFNELVTGYRIRHNGNNYFVDIFVYDSLSSGAGYTTQLQSLLTELFDITRKLLSECKCYSACYDCIKHYFNQFEHATLDRIFALELLDYGKSGLCLNELSPQRQQKLLKPLSLMLNQDNCQLDLNTQILTKGQSHYKVVVFPAMLNKKSPLAHHGSDSHMKYIFLSELDLKHALPNAYKALIDQLI